MMQGLQHTGLEVIYGEPGKFFGLLRSSLKHRPHYLHLDWLHSYYMRRREWMTWVQFPFFLIQVLSITKILQVKLVWTLHNIFPHDRPKHGPHKWARQFFASQCEWIRVFDEETIPRASKALGVHEHKFRVVPEGSYVGYYPNRTNKTEARIRLNLPLKKQIFLYLGLIKPYKGVLELIEAFNEASIPNTILLVAGRSMDPAYWERILHCRKHPDILLREGFVTDEELQYYYHASDIVVLPFKRIENSGSVILAMGFAKPILAPKIGVLKSRLKNQGHLLYNDGELKSKICEVASMTSKELDTIGRSNMEALERHDWGDFAKCFN